MTGVQTCALPISGVLDKGMESFFRNHDILVSVTHPFELVADFFSDTQNAKHPLLSFHPDAVKKNVSAIIRAADKCDKQVRFVTVKDLLNRLNIEEYAK